MADRSNGAANRTGRVGGATSRWLPEFQQAGLIGAAIVAVLFIILKLLRTYSDWPTASSDNLLLTGILILGTLPMLLALVTAVVSERGKLSTKWFEVDLSASLGRSELSVSVPANMGESTRSIADSGSNNILDGLRSATANAVVVLDLGDGRSWWETRLFVLAAGGARLGRPDLVVFVGGGTGQRHFVGFATPTAIRDALVRPGGERAAVYAEALHRSAAAGQAWRQTYAVQGPVAPFAAPPEASALGWPYQDPWAARPMTVPNDMLEEQLIANVLGTQIENGWIDPASGEIDEARAANVTPQSLAALLGSELHREPTVRRGGASSELLAAFTRSDPGWLVEVDDDHQFQRIIPSSQVAQSIVRALAQERLA